MAQLTVPTSFKSSYPDTLALHCSDGRFTEAVHALMTDQKHPFYDIMSLPGGAALLDMSSATIVEVEAMRNGTTFLIQGHGIKFAYLFAHEGCGFYKKRYAGKGSDRIVDRQIHDLQAAAGWMKKRHPNVGRALFFAKVRDSAVVFSPVEEGVISDFTYL